MGEPVQEIVLEGTDQEFQVFPILKVIRMVRNSMNTPVSPLFGSWSENNSIAIPLVAEIGDSSPLSTSPEKSPTEIHDKKSFVSNIGKLSSPRSDQKLEGSTRKNSLTSLALNSENDKSGSQRGEQIHKRSDSDFQDDTCPKTLSQSGVSTDIPNLVVPGFHIQVPPPQFRGSLHLKLSPFQFHIDETDSEEPSSGDERPKSAKSSKSKHSSKSGHGVEEHQLKSVTSNKSQYQGKLSIRSVDSHS